MFLALRELRFARGRFVLVAGVIALLSLLVVMLSGLTQGLTGQSISAIRGLSADHIAFTTPPKGQDASFSDSHITRDQERTWAGEPGVRGAAMLHITPARVEVAHRPVTATVFATSSHSFAGPTALHHGSVVVSDGLAHDEGLRAGDAVQIGDRSFTVAATVSDAFYNHTPVVWMTTQDWKSTASPSSASTVLLLQTTPSADLASADAAAGTTTLARGDTFGAIGSFTAENGSLTIMRVLLLAVGALVAGAFFTVWTIQRSADLAVLKAIGGSSGYLVRDALVQALVVLAVGGGVGAGLAAVAGLLVTGTVPFVVSVGTVLLPLGLIVVLGMVGAAVAVRHITAVDPLTALAGAH